MTTAAEPNRILVRMLERLRAGLLNGPGLNCRPQNSRQRIDLRLLERLSSDPPTKILQEILRGNSAVELPLKLVNPPREQPVEPPTNGGPSRAPRAPIDTRDPYYQQQALLRKLRVLIEDARVYEQDTGVGAMQLGFPLVHLPKGAGVGQSNSRRILAPVAFISVSLGIRSGGRPALELAALAESVDRVVPNPSLVAWMDQLGFKLPDTLLNEDGERDGWAELCALVEWYASTLQLDIPEPFAQARATCLDALQLESASPEEKSARGMLTAAVLGLFPINNQALIRDMEAMIAGEALDGPVRSFIEVGMTLDAAAHAYDDTGSRECAESDEAFLAANERLVADADPCQARAVRLARYARGLVIHGPPGTGKSQTITNIVGDSLLRGQRVLLVSDKRTALDVVADRLEHLGLGDLVAVVHDAGRDQRDLYRTVREQLERLADQRTNAKAETQLKRLDRQIDAMRGELHEAWHALHETTGAPEEHSFHELAGNWLAAQLTTEAQAVYAKGIPAEALRHADLDQFHHDLHDIFTKADVIEYSSSAWAACLGSSLADLLAITPAELRALAAGCIQAGAEADQSCDPRTPAFLPDLPLDLQATAREEIAELLESLQAEADSRIVEHWRQASHEAIESAYGRLRQAESLETAFRAGPLDGELAYLWGPRLPQPDVVARQRDTLARYLQARSLTERLLAIPWWRRSEKLLHEYGLPGGRASATRLYDFLSACQVRQRLWALHHSLLGERAPGEAIDSDDDRPLLVAFNTHHRVLSVLSRLHEEPALRALHQDVLAALADSAAMGQMAQRLRGSRQRALAIQKLHATLEATKLFRTAWLNRVHQQLCQGRKSVPTLQQLEEDLDHCETIARIRESLASLPRPLAVLVEHLLSTTLDATDCLAVLEKLAWESEVKSRLAASSVLTRLDGERLTGHVARMQELRDTKRALVGEAVLHRWVDKQQQRLLVSTRSRLSGEGAELRRRLTMHGSRALRLRKVIALGSDQDGGDPLFDLRPVWMAGPDSVAQIFPRLPLFDIVIFDEASQCRLEEAMPVLTRASRVVIAGDTRQLPPTRFFESALVTDQEEEGETEQDWFEIQQGDVEDLLSGALNLQIDQSYLDVHYRSSNADLIGFSNAHFYASRLQPIPGHPRNRAHFAPISLTHAQGVYDERKNLIEAQCVCRIVRDLLRRAEPPSIGIACFNTDQRDLIVECLDELAAGDSAFAAQLAEARGRKGDGASQGLFVKNLENVQGDERDHMIISTTYGPAPNGRFYRRFGPLGRAGGGRRLNVLVTRARQEVHLVTSIPPAVYRNLPMLNPGQTPNGAWLLFAYLEHAEQLAESYSQVQEALHQRDEQIAQAACMEPRKLAMSDATPSTFVDALGDVLVAEHQQRSGCYWGNDGFCIDVALGHPKYVEDFTIGIKCDFNRYARATDAVEWELFSTRILVATGWTLQRIWTPQFFRDPDRITTGVLQAARQYISTQDEKDAIRVRNE